MVIVTELSLRPRSEKFTAICTIDENFLTGPIGCHSVYTYCTFLLTTLANQHSKQPLKKYSSHEPVSYFQKRECHRQHLM